MSHERAGGAMIYYAKPLARLVEAFERLPTIGPKTAQRLAFHILRAPREEVEEFAQALLDAITQLRPCSQCFNFTEEDPCPICRDPRRDPSVICVVAEPKDVVAIENTGEFHGLYHVLQGLLSPADHLYPEDLRIAELVSRVQRGGVQEVILATSPVVEGDATAIYIAQLLKPLGVRTTRLALGLPVGSDLDYADQVTLARALEGRREI